LYEKYMRLISRKDLNAKFKLQDNVNKEDPVDVAAYHVTRKLRALQDDMRRQYRLANPKPTEDAEITFMIEEVQDPVVSVC
jgi:t-SNARE complex subunit (syntaxin)